MTKMIKKNKKEDNLDSDTILNFDQNLDQDFLYNELLKYFDHLDKKVLKQILKHKDNAYLLNELLNEYKNCILNNICSNSKYHEIPYLELDAKNNYVLVIKREICKKELIKKNQFKFKHYFLIDDFHDKEFCDIIKAFEYINKNTKSQLLNYLKMIVKKIYDKQINKFNKLASFLIEKENEEAFKLFFHEYLISLANNNIYISYIDLINFYDAIKNKYLNDDSYNKYLNAFSHSDLIVLINLDILPYDEQVWTNLYKLLCEYEKQNKYLIVIIPGLLNNIKNAMSATSNNKSASLYGLIQKTLELIKNLIYKSNN